MDLSMSVADVEYEFLYLPLSGSHAPDPPPLIRTGSPDSRRDYGRITVRDMAPLTPGDDAYDYRRDVVEVGERAARWLAAENNSCQGWSSLHDHIFEQAICGERNNMEGGYLTE